MHESADTDDYSQEIKSAIDGCLEYARDLLVEQWLQVKKVGEVVLAKTMPEVKDFCVYN